MFNKKPAPLWKFAYVQMAAAVWSVSCLNGVKLVTTLHAFFLGWEMFLKVVLVEEKRLVP